MGTAFRVKTAMLLRQTLLYISLEQEMSSSGQRTGIANLPLHYGKDGYPYPADRKTYDSSIQFLTQALEKAKIGDKDKLEAFRRLRAWVK